MNTRFLKVLKLLSQPAGVCGKDDSVLSLSAPPPGLGLPEAPACERTSSLAPSRCLPSALWDRGLGVGRWPLRTLRFVFRDLPTGLETPHPRVGCTAFALSCAAIELVW